MCFEGVVTGFAFLKSIYNPYIGPVDLQFKVFRICYPHFRETIKDFTLSDELT